MHLKPKKRQQAQSFKDLKSLSILKRYQKKHKSLKVGSQKQAQFNQKMAQIINVIQLIISRTFQKIDLTSNNIGNFFRQVQQKVDLIQKFDFFKEIPQEFVQFSTIQIQSQPLPLPKHQVIKKQRAAKKLSQQDKRIKQIQNKSIRTKDKLNLLIGINQTFSSKSIKSIKSTRSNRGNNGLPYKIQTIKQQYSQKQRQRRQKQLILNKLKKQHINRIKQQFPEASPIRQNFRSFFTEPETRQYQDLRNSYANLRQLQQRNLEEKRKLKLQINQLKQQNLTKHGIKKMPIRKLSKIGNIALDESGQIILMKKGVNQQNSVYREASLTVYHPTKPFLTPLNQISNIYNNSQVTLKNQKIIQLVSPQVYLNDKYDQDNQIESKIIKKLESYKKNGVKISQSINKHRATASVSYFKLPKISKANISCIQKQSKKIQ